MAWYGGPIGSAWGGQQGGGLGGNPQVPLPTETLPGAVSGNQQNLGQLYGLAGSTNQFNIGQAQQPLIQGLPNYQGMVAQSSANIGQMLQGQVPSDVISQILQGAAERGITTGSSGSPNSNAAYLRALGQTSLGLQQTGEQELTGAIARTPQAPLFNPASFYVTPPQQQEAAAANAIYAAAPNPTAVAHANLGAAQAGLGAGGAAVRPPTAPTLPGGGQVLSSQSPFADTRGLTYSGTTPEAYAGWENWAQSLPGSMPGTNIPGGGQFQDTGAAQQMDPFFGATDIYGGGGGGGGDTGSSMDYFSDFINQG